MANTAVSVAAQPTPWSPRNTKLIWWGGSSQHNLNRLKIISAHDNMISKILADKMLMRQEESDRFRDKYALFRRWDYCWACQCLQTRRRTFPRAPAPAEIKSPDQLINKLVDQSTWQYFTKFDLIRLYLLRGIQIVWLERGRPINLSWPAMVNSQDSLYHTVYTFFLRLPSFLYTN